VPTSSTGEQGEIPALLLHRRSVIAQLGDGVHCNPTNKICYSALEVAVQDSVTMEIDYDKVVK